MNTNRKVDLTLGAFAATDLALWALFFCLLMAAVGCGEIPDVYTEPVEDVATTQDAPIFTADCVTLETAPDNPGLNFRPREPVPHPGKPDSINVNPNQIDWDGDGFLPVDGDCDNFDPDVGPGFFDYCDNLNNDCDDEIDEGTAEEHVFCTKDFNGVPTQGLLWCVHWAEDDRIVAEVLCELDCQWEEVCDDVDNDCDGVVDEECELLPECETDADCVRYITECLDSICMGPDEGCSTYLRDDDGDGWSRCGIDGREPPDCNDNNPLVNPGTAEICGDGVDNDCDAAIDEDDCFSPPTECSTNQECNERYGDDCLVYICGTDGYCTYSHYRDDDNDGYLACGGVLSDCDDSDPAIYPGAPELCDGIDSDCDGETDEGTYCAACPGGPTMPYYRDSDDDGYGDPNVSERMCSGAGATGWIDIDGDCDDSDPAIYPGAPEICDSKDNDCDGLVDDAYPPPPCATDDDCSCHEDECTILRCIEGRCLGYGRDDDGDGAIACGDNPDCNDSDPAIYPGAAEVCDFVDNDCDGMIDENTPIADRSDCDGYIGDADCDPNNPDVHWGAPEICHDGVDNDCDGTADEDCFCDHTLTLFSNSETITSTGSLAVPTWNENSRWTASIPGATWIWDEYLETSPRIDSTVRFTRVFPLPADAMAISGTLQMSADNSFYAWLNGEAIGDSQSEFNYFEVFSLALTPFLAPGSNSLTWEVKNWAQHHGTAYTNPGGLLWRVDLSYLSAEGCDSL